MEQGLIIPQGIGHVRKSLPGIIEDLENELSLQAEDYLSELYTEFVDCDADVAKYEARITGFAKSDEAGKQLQKIPGVGPLTATDIVAHVGDAKQFTSGRAFAASLGLTPKEHSSGGKQKLRCISKRGPCYIRRLLVQERVSLHGMNCCVPRSKIPVRRGSKIFPGGAVNTSPP